MFKSFGNISSHRWLSHSLVRFDRQKQYQYPLSTRKCVWLEKRLQYLLSTHKCM